MIFRNIPTDSFERIVVQIVPWNTTVRDLRKILWQILEIVRDFQTAILISQVPRFSKTVEWAELKRSCVLLVYRGGFFVKKVHFSLIAIPCPFDSACIFVVCLRSTVVNEPNRQTSGIACLHLTVDFQ